MAEVTGSNPVLRTISFRPGVSAPGLFYVHHTLVMMMMEISSRRGKVSQMPKLGRHGFVPFFAGVLRAKQASARIGAMMDSSGPRT